MAWWPWVSRRALDLALEERDRLVEQNAALTDALTRMSRFERGMSETPRPPRKKADPLPRWAHEYLLAFSDPAIRRNTRKEMLRRHREDGVRWEDMKMELEVDESAAEAGA